MQLTKIIQQKEKSPHTPLKEKLNPIANSQLDKTNRTNSLLVDHLLRDYQELIDPSYKKWFAKRFYTMPFDQIHRCASEARQDGKNPQRLFAFLIKKMSI